jgi:hypothetical protein
MRRRPIMLAALAAVALATACSSSSSSTATAQTGTETLTAVVTGSEAASQLNSNSNAPLTFPEGTWTGLIATTLKPFSLGGNSVKGTAHWATPDGTTTVYHAAAAGFTNNNAPPPASATHWVKSGTDCSLTVTFSKGTFQFLPAQSTGKFAQLSGTGTYTVVVQGVAPLKSGDASKPCGFNTIGNIKDGGAMITFTATAPAVLHPAASPTS